jgi:hypothetical protein
MSDHDSRAKYYLEKAEEVGAIAEDIKDPMAKRMLQAVASDYVHMAKMIQDMKPKEGISPPVRDFLLAPKRR